MCADCLFCVCKNHANTDKDNIQADRTESKYRRLVGNISLWIAEKTKPRKRRGAGRSRNRQVRTHTHLKGSRLVPRLAFTDAMQRDTDTMMTLLSSDVFNIGYRLCRKE